MVKPLQHFHKFDIELLEEQLLSLLSIYNSSTENYRTLSEKAINPFSEATSLQVITERSISRLLIAVAPQLRMIDDRIKGSKFYIVKENSVGVMQYYLIEGYEEQDLIDNEEERVIANLRNNKLSFRESCNKLIHSYFVQFPVWDTPKGIKMSSVHCEGRHKKRFKLKDKPKEGAETDLLPCIWVVSINVRSFIAEAFNLLTSFKNDPENSSYIQFT